MLGGKRVLGDFGVELFDLEIIVVDLFLHCHLLLMDVLELLLV